jgi:phosphohistidine phosphatase
MQLFVIRHGIAEDAGPDQVDADRALTKDGKKKLKQVVRGMRAVGWKLDRVVSSPWRRAMQTAAVVSKHEPIVTDLLTTSPRSDLLYVLNRPGEAVGVVGHEPWLSELVAWLVLGDSRHGDIFELKKSSVALLDGEVVPGGMTLHGLLPPRVLRSVR